MLYENAVECQAKCIGVSMSEKKGKGGSNDKIREMIYVGSKKFILFLQSININLQTDAIDRAMNNWDKKI